MKEIRDDVIKRMADEILAKIKNGKLFGEPIDLSDRNETLVAVYYMCKMENLSGGSFVVPTIFE